MLHAELTPSERLCRVAAILAKGCCATGSESGGANLAFWLQIRNPLPSALMFSGKRG